MAALGLEPPRGCPGSGGIGGSSGAFPAPASHVWGVCGGVRRRHRGHLLPVCPQIPNRRVLPQAGAGPTRLPRAWALVQLVPPLALVRSEMERATATRLGTGLGSRSGGTGDRCPPVPIPERGIGMQSGRCRHHPTGSEGGIQPTQGRRCPIPQALWDTRHGPTDSPTAPGPSAAAAAGSAQTLPQVETKAAGPVPVPCPRCPQTAWCHQDLMRARGRWAQGLHTHTHTHTLQLNPSPAAPLHPIFGVAGDFFGGSPVPPVLPAPCVGLGGS